MPTTPTPTGTTPAAAGTTPAATGTTPTGTTPADTTPNIDFFNISVIGSSFKMLRALDVGAGNAQRPYESATARVQIEQLEISELYPTEIDYTIYDENGKKDKFGDPETVVTGKCSVKVFEGKYLIDLNVPIQGVANASTGELRFSVELTQSDNQLSPAIITSISVGPNISRAPIGATAEPYTQEGGQATTGGTVRGGFTTPRTLVETPQTTTTTTTRRFSGNQQTAVDRLGNDDFTSPTTTTPALDLQIPIQRSALTTTTTTTVTFTTQPIDSDIINVTTTEPMDIDVVEVTTTQPADDPSGQDTGTTPSTVAVTTTPDVTTTPRTDTSNVFFPVASEAELKDALSIYTKIVIQNDIVLRSTVNVPGNTVIRGLNNPTVTFNGNIGFDIREDNVILRNFSIKNTREVGSTNGVGIQITKPTRDSLAAPKNITIDSINFDRVGGFKDKFASILVTGYNFIQSQADSDSLKPGLLDGSEPIQNITITNNVITNSPNNGLDLWEIDGLIVSNNTVTNTRGQHEQRGNGIRGDGLRNAVITNNTFSNIGRSGIEITGKDTNNILVENNIINEFTKQRNFLNTFTSGISIAQGASNGTISNNQITGSGRGGGVEVSQNSSNFIVASNNISQVNKGVIVSAHSDNVTVDSNTISLVNIRSIEVFQSWNIHVTDNAITQLSKDSLAGKTVEPSIVVQQSNGVTVINNVITGDYFQENNETAILVQGNYPTQDNFLSILYPSGDTEEAIRLKHEIILYSQGQVSVYNDIYNPPSSLATDTIRNSFGGNILDGSGRVFFSNMSKIIFPLTKPGGLESEGASKIILNDFSYPEVDSNAVILSQIKDLTTIQEYIRENESSMDELSNRTAVLIKVDLTTGTYNVSKLGDETTVTSPTTTPTLYEDDPAEYTLTVRNDAPNTIKVNGTLIGGGGEDVIGPQSRNAFYLDIDYKTSNLPFEGAGVPLRNTGGNFSYEVGQEPLQGGGRVISELRGDPPSWRSTINGRIIEPAEDGNFYGSITFDEWNEPPPIIDDVTTTTTTTTTTPDIITGGGGDDTTGYDPEVTPAPTTLPGTTTSTTPPGPIFYGCTDPNASNWNEIANVDDGSCEYDYPTTPDVTTTPYYPPPGGGTTTSTTPYNNPVYSLIVFNETEADITVNGEPVPPGQKTTLTSLVNRFTFTVNSRLVNINTIIPESGINVDATFVRIPPNELDADAIITRGYTGSVFITSATTPTTPYPTTTTSTTPYVRPPQRGCTDINAWNYDPFATVDDGSCEYDYPTTTTSTTPWDWWRWNIPGCMDDGNQPNSRFPGEPAANFNPFATIDDGSCVWPPRIPGCMDDGNQPNSRFPGIPAKNFDPTANVDDGSCMWDQGPPRRPPGGTTPYLIEVTTTPYPTTPPPPPRPGCTDPTAWNHDPLATVDDGSCIFLPRLGCMDDGNQPNSRFPGRPAKNFDPFAQIDDGSCIWDPIIDPPPIFGCTNPRADNFNPAATVDDGSCRFPPIPPDPPDPPEPPKPEDPFVPAHCGKPPVPRAGTGDDAIDLGSDPGSSTNNTSTEGGGTIYGVAAGGAPTNSATGNAGGSDADDDATDDSDAAGDDDGSREHFKARGGVADSSDAGANGGEESQDRGDFRPTRPGQAAAAASSSGPIFCAPVNALEQPFYSDVNFNTNITREAPGAYTWEEEEQVITTPPVGGTATTTTDTPPVVPGVTTSTTLSPEDIILIQKAQLCEEEEDCKKFNF